MQNLTESRESRVTESRVSESRSKSSRSSMSTSTNLAEASLARGFDGLELPSLSSGEVDIDELSDSALPTVTSPLGTIEMPDGHDFGSDSSEKSGLTSPNLVSTLASGGLTLSNASPMSKMSIIPAMSGSLGSAFTGTIPCYKLVLILVDVLVLDCESLHLTHLCCRWQKQWRHRGKEKLKEIK